MSSKSALILGTLAGQVDAMRLLKDRGWTVYSCGHRREGPGVSAADGFFLVDILDVEAVAELAAGLDVDIVYSVGSDIAMPTVARVSRALGLPMFHSVETTDILQRKDLLRGFLESAGMSPVRHRRIASVADIAGFDAYPAIVKPSDSQGQRGITIVDSPSEAEEAALEALSFSNSGTAIIEEWLDGPEISVHVFAVDGDVRFFLPSDRQVWEGDLVGIAAGHVMPAHALDDENWGAVRALVDAFVENLGITDGPLYFQMKVTADGPRIIEVASRLDGCHLWRLIEQHTGFNLMDACFRFLAGEPWIDPQPWTGAGDDELRFLLGPPDRPFRFADFPELEQPGIVFKEIQVREGERPRDTNGVISRLGYYTMKRFR